MVFAWKFKYPHQHKSHFKGTQEPSPILAKIIHSWYVESKNGWNFLVHHWTSEIIWKWHFLEKIWQISFQERIVPLLYLVINICNDRLSQQSFLVALSNSSREKYINTTERHAQGASAVCNKNFTGRSQLNTAGQCQIYWEADPQPSAQVSYTASAQNSGTVPQDWQLLKAWTSYQIYIWITWFFFPNKPLSNYLWWPMMKTNFYPFFRF